MLWSWRWNKKSSVWGGVWMICASGRWADWGFLQTAGKTRARQCMSSRGMSVATNHCQEQCFHPTSAQQSRAGPQFKQISHSASGTATPDDDLEPGHQKPYLLWPPSATSVWSKAVQPLHCAGHNPWGELASISGLCSPPCTAPAPARLVLHQGTPSCVAAGQPQLLPFRPQSFGATLPWREGKHP